MGLRWRITLPLLALSVVVLGATLWLSVRLVERAVERRFQAQADSLARLMSSRRFPVNDVTVRYFAEAFDADVTVTRGSEILASTDPKGERFLVVRAPVILEQGPGELSLHFRAEIVDRERDRAVRPVMIVGIAAIALAAGLGILLAHAVARPLERLARQAAAGRASPVPPVGGGREMDQLVGALNRMAEQIRRGEQLAVMGRMAAAMAHEIKNPLAAMKMNVQMLREGASDREPYDLLLREIERLELAAGELGGRPERPVKRRVPLPEVVDEVLELLKPQLAHLRIAVDRRVEGRTEAEVDVARFKRAIMNLVLNGAQAMPSGGPLVVAVGRSGNGAARLSVTDAGSGIPEEIRDRIFEPFVTTKQDGVGLGLALTKEIVEEHGGRISFESSPRGTTFTVEIPAHE